VFADGAPGLDRERAMVDVADLFRQLGVIERNGAIVYDDGAPLAGIRRRITEPRDRPEREIIVRF